MIRLLQNAVGWCKRRLGMVKFNVIACVENNYGVGKDNDLPWPRIPEDMSLFKRKTVESGVVIMGSKTRDSIPVGLPGRTCIIVSRQPPRTNLWAGSVEEALNLAAYHCKTGTVWIIGGAEIWQRCFELDVVDQLWLTHLKADYASDTRFPIKALQGWWSAPLTTPLAYYSDGKTVRAYLLRYRRERNGSGIGNGDHGKSRRDPLNRKLGERKGGRDEQGDNRSLRSGQQGIPRRAQRTDWRRRTDVGTH